MGYGISDDPEVNAAKLQAIMQPDHPLVSSVTEISAKTLVTKYSSDENLFGTLYNMNLYRGCGHGCIYCDTRSDCYGIIDISHIAIKENAIALLRDELRRKRVKGVISTGSMNDPYMPLEAEKGLTRQALLVCLELGFPVHVITKSALVLRDLDILQEMAKEFAVVTFSITTVDETLARRIEPGASSPTQRLAAITALRRAGVHSGAAMMPFIPGLTDGEESICSLVGTLKAHDAEYAMPGCLTLRGAGRAYFYSRMAAISSEALKLTQSIYGERYTPPRQYAQRVYGTASAIVRQAGLLLQPPRWRPVVAQEQLALFGGDGK